MRLTNPIKETCQQSLGNSFNIQENYQSQNGMKNKRKIITVISNYQLVLYEQILRPNQLENV